MANSKYEYVKRDFEFNRELPPSNWIIVRIVGCNFHRKILSVCVSYFTSVYEKNWKHFFPKNDGKEHPHFDARVVCYPNIDNVHDYLAWRQVDCHINNQYNTCFWMLIKSGKPKNEAYEALKGTSSMDKNKLLLQ